MVLENYVLKDDNGEKYKLYDYSSCYHQTRLDKSLLVLTSPNILCSPRTKEEDRNKISLEIFHYTKDRLDDYYKKAESINIDLTDKTMFSSSDNNRILSVKLNDKKDTIAIIIEKIVADKDHGCDGVYNKVRHLLIINRSAAPNHRYTAVIYNSKSLDGFIGLRDLDQYETYFSIYDTTVSYIVDMHRWNDKLYETIFNYIIEENVTDQSKNFITLDDCINHGSIICL